MSEFNERELTAEERDASGYEILSVGLGKYDGYQDVVLLSYLKLDDGTVLANVIDVDMSTKRQVPAELIRPYHIRKGELFY